MKRVRFFTFGSLVLLLLSLNFAQPAQAASDEEHPAPVADDAGKKDLSPETVERIEQYFPGRGFDVAKGERGSLNISAYVLLRYLNQLPSNQTFVDHLGNTQVIDPRNDIELHRILVHFRGFLFDERFTYDTILWTVNSTVNTTTISALSYEFDKAFVLGGGIGALPGTRSMNYEHPYFLGTDRQMADEFFRPSFTGGVWVSGTVPDFYYRFMIGDSMNLVNIKANQLTRDFAYGATVAWMPATGEFGPKGAFGDFEMHDRLATRFGISGTWSPYEDRLSQVDNPNPDNTTIRLSDSLPLFQADALGAGTTVQKTDFKLLSLDASFKYRGFFFMTEFYFRHLSRFYVAGPAPPLNSMDDSGFELQTSYMLVPQKFELYGMHSQVFGQFNHSWELGAGANYYPYKSRDLKLNLSVDYVDRSPTSSLFGYFVGGEKGPIIAASTDLTF